MQESKLRNLAYGDRDSLGLFQQRPSPGLGHGGADPGPGLRDDAFYDALVKVDGYETMPITEAAQEVQRSAFPRPTPTTSSEGRGARLGADRPLPRRSDAAASPTRPGRARRQVVKELGRAGDDRADLGRGRSR